MDKRKERQIKIFIWLFSLFLFVAGLGYLVLTEKVRFAWFDNYLAKREYERSKAAPTRILLLGDSHLEYMPQDICLSKLIRSWSKDNGIGLINLAHHGFGPLEYQDQLARVAPDFRPTHIVLFYYAGNDLSDVMYRPDLVPMERSYEVAFLPPSHRLDASGKRKEIDKQRRVKTLEGHNFDWALFEEKGVDPEMVEFAKNRLLYPLNIGPEFVNPHLLVLGTWQPDFHYHNLQIEDVKARGSWFTVMACYELMLRMAEEIGAQFTLVVIPSNVQVDTSHYDFYRKLTFRVDNDLTEIRKPQELLGAFAGASGIQFIDLLPEFKSAPNHSELYMENDNHFSFAGHELAFDIVKRDVLEPIHAGKKVTDLTNRQRNYLMTFENWRLDYHRNRILNDEAWRQAIEEKAVKRSVTFEEALDADLHYLLNEDLKKRLGEERQLE